MERNSRIAIIQTIQIKLIFDTTPEIDVFVNQIKVNTNLGSYKHWPEYCPYYDIPGSSLEPVDTKTLLPEWQDIQARDDDKSDDHPVSFDMVVDYHIVSNQSISIIPLWSKSQDLTLNSIIFDNIEINANKGILRVCDITTYKCGDYIQKGNLLNDPDSSLKVEFKTPLYDWLLDSIL